jgi:hypothetical protein
VHSRKEDGSQPRGALSVLACSSSPAVPRAFGVDEEYAAPAGIRTKSSQKDLQIRRRKRKGNTKKNHIQGKQSRSFLFLLFLSLMSLHR